MVQILPIDEVKQALAEKLRSEVDDLWLQEIKPPTGIKYLYLPRVFGTPEGEVKVVFNKLDTTEIYVADMNEDLEIGTPLKVPIAGRVSSIVYDSNFDNWLVLVTSAVNSRRYGLYRLSRDFKSVVASQDPMLVDGAEWDTGGTGTLYIPRTDRLWGLLDGGWGTELALADPRVVLPSFSRRPYPVVVQAPEYGTIAGEPGHGYATDGVGPLLNLGDAFVFNQNIHGADHGGSVLCFGYWDEAKKALVGGIDYTIMFGYSTLGHCHYMGWVNIEQVTDILLKRHCTAIVSAVQNDWEFSRIYAFKMPWELLNPRKHALIYTLWFQNTISANETSPAMPGFGRKTIHFTSDTLGNLTAYLDAVGRNDWKSVGVQTGVTSVLAQTEWSGLRMRFGFSAAATVTLHVVAEPR